MDDTPNTNELKSPEVKKAKKYSSQAALAMELPCAIVGAVLLGGALGYFLDHWLHTKLIFTLVLGALGFAGGLKEGLRRVAQRHSWREHVRGFCNCAWPSLRDSLTGPVDRACSAPGPPCWAKILGAPLGLNSRCGPWVHGL